MESHDCARRIAPSGVTMSRTAFFLATLVLTSAIPAFAQTTDNATSLLNRIAAKNGGTAEVFVAKLPTDMPKVPLPAATLVGSVHESVESPITIDSYDLYYDAAPGALKTYGDALTAAGWKQHQLPTNRGGFVSSTGPQSAIYCKASGPLITAQIGTNPKDLNLSINTSGSTSDLLCGKNPITSFMKAFTASVLPQLHAPDGVRMSVSPMGIPNGQSAAYIHNGTSANALIDGFAAQMGGAGWTAGPKSTGSSIVSQTFAKLDDKKVPWQCTISIQAVDGKPGEFVAFIDTADLSALAKGSSAMFSH
jgi:hypothetical protein